MKTHISGTKKEARKAEPKLVSAEIATFDLKQLVGQEVSAAVAQAAAQIGANLGKLLEANQAAIAASIDAKLASMIAPKPVAPTAPDATVQVTADTDTKKEAVVTNSATGEAVKVTVEAVKADAEKTVAAAKKEADKEVGVLGGLFNTLKGWVFSLARSIADLMVQGLDAVTDAINRLGSWLQGACVSIGESASAICKAVFDFLARVLEGVTNLFREPAKA